MLSDQENNANSSARRRNNMRLSDKLASIMNESDDTCVESSGVEKAYADFNDLADKIKRRFGKKANDVFDSILDADDSKLRKMSLKDGDANRLAYYTAWIAKAREMTEDKEVKKPSLIEEIESILGGTVVVNLAPKVEAQTDVVEETKSIISDEWVIKMKQMTARNQHNEVNIEKAKLIKATAYVKKFELIGQLADMDNGMSKSLWDYSYEESKKIDEYAKNKLSDEDYQKFRRV